jgi:hypothetical protein
VKCFFFLFLSFLSSFLTFVIAFAANFMNEFSLAVRNMSSKPKPDAYKEKSFKEAWLSDPGVSF